MAAPKKESRGKLTDLYGEPPQTIRRSESECFTRAHMLGEGGFARVYAATAPDGLQRAIKVISKQQLKSSKTKQKLFAEIKIHQAMHHPNIIHFENCFEDAEHVYMQLEICANGSLLDLLRKRKRYTEPETRYYVTQLVGACEYMQSCSVIHRDLKLGNLMLNDAMDLKVGDFGLAALVKFPGERKKTICGTPNYIAPEILFDQSVGHSYEADTWSIGVIIYTLLCGKPPFQTKDVKAIYKKIKTIEYSFPTTSPPSSEAVDLISSILTRSPEDRPSLAGILSHAFFDSSKPFPKRIPSSAYHVAPSFQMTESESRRNFERCKKTAGIGTTMPIAVPTKPSVLPRTTFQTGATSESESEEEEVVQIPPTTTPKKVDPVTALSAQVEATKLVSPAKPGSVVAVSASLASSAQDGVDKEVRKALNPDSPISDLLRSARKPLMVSPATSDQPRDALRRQARDAISTGSPRRRDLPSASTSRLSAVTRTQPRTSSDSQKENRPPADSIAQPQVPKRLQTVKESEAVEEEKVVLPGREMYSTFAEMLEKGVSASRGQLAWSPSTEDLAAPKVFVASWIDYTHKYGTAYQLTDGSSGVYFNDSTTMVLSPSKNTIDYISSRSKSSYIRRNYGLETAPSSISRKVYLIKYFDKYMTDTLDRGNSVPWNFKDLEREKNLEFLVKYYRTKHAILFKISNGVLQFNFFDHCKILLSHNAQLVTYIDSTYELSSYSLSSLIRHANRLDVFATATQTDEDAKRIKKKELLLKLWSKLEYIKEILSGLASRKNSASDEVEA